MADTTTPKDKEGEGTPDKRALLSKLIDAAAAYTFSREMLPIKGFAERIDERGFELAEAYRTFARADAFTILDEPEETARLREQVKELREGLAWIEKIADMNFEQDEKLRADGARTLKRISDRARALMEKTNV